MNNTLIGPVALFKYAWNQYKSHWKIFTTILILPYALMLVGNAIITTLNPGLVFVGFIVTFAAVVLSCFAYTGLIKTANDLDVNSSAQISIKEQYSFGMKMFWSVVLISIIQNFVTFGSGVLFVIPGIIVCIYIAFGYFALVVDGKKGFAALTESFSLVRSRWWKVLGRILFVVLVQVILMLVITGIRFLLASTMEYSLASPVDTVVSMILSMILGLFFIPLVIVYMTKLYTSLKATRVAEVATVTFKRWLVAFVVIGVIAIPGLFVSVFLASLNSARMKAEMVRQGIEQAALQQNLNLDTTSTQ